MKLFKLRQIFYCFFLLLISLTSHAWNALGHMVVAQIAYQQLQADVREKVDYLSLCFNREYPEMTSYLDLAYWPDTLRGQNIQLFTHWHYIDNPISFDNTPSNNNHLDTDNAVWAESQIENIVKNDNANLYERARFLAFFIHIVADLHQPLHTVALFSANHKEGDQGGNKYMVWYKNKHTNLHGIWDRGVGIFDGSRSHAHAYQVASAIQANYPIDFFGKKVNELNPAAWAQEGKQYAKQYVYQVAEEGIISATYEEKSRKVVEQMTALSGYRLAKLLNLLL